MKIAKKLTFVILAAFISASSLMTGCNETGEESSYVSPESKVVSQTEKSLCIGLQLVALIYGLLVQRVCDVPSFVSFLCAGMLRYAPWMVCVALCSFLYSGLRFVLL